MKDEIKALFFLENIKFWKFLPRVPEFEYLPLCERFFGFREAFDLTGTKMRLFRCNFAKFYWGMPPDPPIMVAPSAHTKLICDVTRLWQNFGPPSETFCVRHRL